jgi:hypothetical protein
MRGWQNVEMQSDPKTPGAFALVRRPAARSLSRLLIAVSLAAAGFDLWVHRPWLALAQLGLMAAFLLLHLIAEARSWRFASDEVVVRTFELGRLRVREEKLRANQISRVGLARQGTRARAWLELKSGQSYALVEGRVDEVEKIAFAVQRAVLLASIEAKGQTLH